MKNLFIRIYSGGGGGKSMKHLKRDATSALAWLRCSLQASIKTSRSRGCQGDEHEDDLSPWMLHHAVSQKVTDVSTVLIAFITPTEIVPYKQPRPLPSTPVPIHRLTSNWRVLRNHYCMFWARTRVITRWPECVKDALRERVMYIMEYESGINLEGWVLRLHSRMREMQMMVSVF
jgi:hypothetical protein